MWYVPGVHRHTPCRLLHGALSVNTNRPDVITSPDCGPWITSVVCPQPCKHSDHTAWLSDSIGLCYTLLNRLPCPNTATLLLCNLLPPSTGQQSGIWTVYCKSLSIQPCLGCLPLEGLFTGFLLYILKFLFLYFLQTKLTYNLFIFSSVDDHDDLS